MQALQLVPTEDLGEIRTLSIFACVSEEELGEVLSHARRRAYQRGQVIHHVDDVAGDVFIIVKGHVKHRLLAPDGRQITHNIQNPASFFGVMSVLDGKRRASDAVALTDCEVLVIDRDIIGNFLERHPEATEALLQRYVASSRRMEMMLHDQAFLSVPMRLAKALLEYAISEGEGGDGDMLVPAYLNQTELAFLVGTSRESVNQSLKQFAAWNWIKSDRKNLRILDKAALLRFASH